MATVTEVRVVECESGCELLEEDGPDFEPLYECGNCGTVFTRSNSADGGSHKCPDCNKFSTRLGLACPECESQVGEDLYKVDYTTKFRCDECEKLHETDEDAESCCGEDEGDLEPGELDRNVGVHQLSDKDQAIGREAILEESLEKTGLKIEYDSDTTTWYVQTGPSIVHKFNSIRQAENLVIARGKELK